MQDENQPPRDSGGLFPKKLFPPGTFPKHLLGAHSSLGEMRSDVRLESVTRPGNDDDSDHGTKWLREELLRLVGRLSWTAGVLDKIVNVLLPIFQRISTRVKRSVLSFSSQVQRIRGRTLPRPVRSRSP